MNKELLERVISILFLLPKKEGEDGYNYLEEGDLKFLNSIRKRVEILQIKIPQARSVFKDITDDEIIKLEQIAKNVARKIKEEMN